MTILGATGHQDIPPQAAQYIVDELGEHVQSAGRPLEGVSSLAAGADQLFAEAVLNAGGTLRAVIPSKSYDKTFRREADLIRYRATLAQADHQEVLPFSQPSEKAFLAAGKRIVDLCELLIAVWDGRQARGLGGTGDVVRYAKRVGKRVEIVWPEGVSRNT